MNNRFVWDETFIDYIIDNKENESVFVVDVVGLLNKQDQRIAELEEENKTFQKHYIKMVKKEVEENYFDLLKDLQLYKEDNAKLEKENAKLQEQLKNVFCPKYRLGEEKWYVEENGYCNYEVQVFNGNINEIVLADWDGEPTLYYKFDTSARYILEEEIFDSEAEAQKYLEEKNEDNFW